MVLDDHRKVCGVDVRQFGTIPVATTDDTLLGIIIIGTGEEVSKDEFGVPETLFLVHFYRNTTERTIILDGYGTRFLIDGNRDGTDLLGVERVAVNSID